MPPRKQSRGLCTYCGLEVSKNSVIRHLAACPKRQAAIEAGARSQAKTETLFHLRVQDAWRKEFWLDLEMRGSSSLQDLDDYLRGIWLECCGHLSRFSIGGWRGDEIPMRRCAAQVFKPEIELTHIYDFGTSSETLIKVVGIRKGPPISRMPLTLMARNIMPEAACIICGQAAAWFCMECVIEEDGPGTLCAEHVAGHPHDNYGDPLRLVNSPRLGMCGYDGPAEPPY